MKKLLLVAFAVIVVALFFFFSSGSFLVIDRPEKADIIVALAGETDRRPTRALELLSLKYAPRVMLDVPDGERIYGPTTLELARQYVAQSPHRDLISICPISGLSTKAETQDVAGCLKQFSVHSVLLVTSDFHTRRALSTFSHELPQYHFSVTAAYDTVQFGGAWWQRRQWAKLNLSEWLRLAWWEGIDRWH